MYRLNSHLAGNAKARSASVKLPIACIRYLSLMTACNPKNAKQRTILSLKMLRYICNSPLTCHLLRGASRIRTSCPATLGGPARLLAICSCEGGSVAENDRGFASIRHENLFSAHFG